MLSVDADERVSPALAQEIERVLAEGGADGYEVPRLSSFVGHEMRHSGWFPDYVLRLFRRGKARFSDDLVHERVICEGPVARLTEHLAHDSVTRLEQAISRVDRYSTAGAEMLVASGRRVSFWASLKITCRLGCLSAAALICAFISTRQGSPRLHWLIPIV